MHLPRNELGRCIGVLFCQCGKATQADGYGVVAAVDEPYVAHGAVVGRDGVEPIGARLGECFPAVSVGRPLQAALAGFARAKVVHNGGGLLVALNLEPYEIAWCEL